MHFTLQDTRRLISRSVQVNIGEWYRETGTVFVEVKFTALPIDLDMRNPFSARALPHAPLRMENDTFALSEAM